MVIENGVITDIVESDLNKDGGLIIPEGVIVLGYKLTENVKTSLKYVVLPPSVREIKFQAFTDCVNLERVELNEGLTTIGGRVFQKCKSLKEINIPSTVTELADAVFLRCESLEKADLSSNISEIKISSFYGCENLKSIKLPENITQIGAEAFKNCAKLENINLGDSVRIIGDQAFYGAGLKNANLSGSLELIGELAFAKSGLTRLDVPSQVQASYRAFSECNNLEKVKFAHGTKKVGACMFKECINLKEVELPSTIKDIETGAFESCESLTKINLPEGLESISSQAFCECISLEEIHIPKSVRVIGNNCLSDCIRLKRVSIYSNVEVERQEFFFPQEGLTITNVSTGEKVNHPMKADSKCLGTRGLGIMIGDTNYLSFFDANNNWVKVEKSIFSKYGDYYRRPREYKMLYEWIRRKKFVPHETIVENMKTEDIDNFYINNNSKKWGQLVKLANIDLDEEKGAFFKLCYALGLFSKNGKESDRAFNYIKDNVIKNIARGEYHIEFGLFKTLSHGYNSEFAELFFKYYADNPKFLYDEDLDYSYISNVYNNYDKIKQIYPNKVINTNTNNERLTPEMCIEAVKIKKLYGNVTPGNEQFARNIGMYGYSQEAFDAIQELFDRGKNIPPEEITIHASKDDQNNLITYELLDKDNPLGVILGNITNCCQVIGGVGSKCLEYGLSERNSKFMVFRSGQVIMGQSWVWYDEATKRICLDNIEVPRTIINKYMGNETYKNEFIKCLKRSVKGFVEEMKNKGLDVKSITIGQGYNDIRDLLDANFKIIYNQPKLTGYNEYSDATNQYVMYENEPNNRGR